MTVNFQFLQDPSILDFNSTWTVDDHYKWLSTKYSTWGKLEPALAPPEGYESYYCIDVAGDELKWLNNSLPKEQYTWYAWFESVFLVPEEIYTMLALRWT
jgi:hypothetical protein